QLVCGEEESVSVALQTLINRHIAFDALLVSDYIKSREAIALLRSFQRQVPQDVMVFSLDGAVPVVGAPEMPQMAWPLDMLAQRALQLIGGENVAFPPLRGSLIAP
ncbi:MAG: LacI family transcriptional regulator, partial [Mixta calida]|nr:LacI family transcriptional regulator [Mixta calida]